jgi:hypothetical protein
VRHHVVQVPGDGQALIAGAATGLLGLAVPDRDGPLVPDPDQLRDRWSIILESMIGASFNSIRPYLPYTAATSLAGTALGAAGFGPSRAVSPGTPLSFVGATALLAGLAAVLAFVAARTTVRRDIS